MFDIQSDIKEILDAASPAWGVSSFRRVREYLIDCAAKKRIPDGAESIISLLFPYNLGEESYADSNISRYAAVPDYHGVASLRLGEAAERLRELLPDERFTAFIDNSPIPEVSAAVAAGLGVGGSNGVLINPVFGSWVFIGEIVTTLPPEKITDRLFNDMSVCVRCGACVAACPTGALSEKGLDPALCLSRISQQKEPLTDAQKELIRKSGCAWGCDICQSVCPMNKGAKTTPIREFIENKRTRASLGDSIEGRAFAWRGEKVIERNLSLFEDEES